MGIKVGVAAGCWGVDKPGEPGQVPWDRFLDESHQAGYEWVEAGMYGYLPDDLGLVRSKLDELGTGITSTTVMKGHLEDPGDWPELEAEVLKAGEFGAELGAKQLVLIDDLYAPREWPAPPLGRDSWARLIDATHRVADIAKEKFGLPIAFHAHVQTHVETEEQLEAFLQDTDRDRVSLCLDTGHHAFRGGDPVDFLRRHHDRVSYMHFKNLDRAVLDKVLADDIPVKDAKEIGVYRPLDSGMIDYREVGELLRDKGYDGWVVVEQELGGPSGAGALDLAKQARDYLRQVGIG